MCIRDRYAGMLFWIGDRLPSGFQVFVSICIVAGNTGFTVFVVAVFVRALVREARKDGDQSEKALKRLLRERSSGQRVAAAAAGSAQQDLPRKRVATHMGRVGRGGTIKGSLRYNVGVAIQMTKAQQNAKAYQSTLQVRKEKLTRNHSAAQSRLRSRIAMRRTRSQAAQSNASGAAAVVPLSAGLPTKKRNLANAVSPAPPPPPKNKPAKRRRKKKKKKKKSKKRDS